jgi:hypothetical protein
MLSFAPFLYRNVFAEMGGPIQRTENAGTLDVAGHLETQVNAFLKPELALGKMHHAVYGNADGTGSSRRPGRRQAQGDIRGAGAVGIFLPPINSGQKARYGFEHDRSSNGIAAFPGPEMPGQERRLLRGAGTLGPHRMVGGAFRCHASAPCQDTKRWARFGSTTAVPEEVVVLYRKTESGILFLRARRRPDLAPGRRESRSRDGQERVRPRSASAPRASSARSPISWSVGPYHFSYPRRAFAEFSDRLSRKADKAPLRPGKPYSTARSRAHGPSGRQCGAIASKCRRMPS